MKKEEIYCSFEGKLQVGGPEYGYMIYDIGGGLLQYESIALGTIKRERVRFPAELLPPEDFGDEDKLAELCMDAYYGRRENVSVFFHGSWWGYNAIKKIQERYKDMCWQRHV